MNELSRDLHATATAARFLNVPARWLRAEALAGRLPHLRAGHRLLFHLPTVVRLLAERAAAQTPSLGSEEVRHGP